MKYRPEIDGLRAVAVLPVLLFHAGFYRFSGGFVGVDVFFVISGYLITSILLREMEAGTFSLVNFYERRARRILPALFGVILFCLPFAFMWLQPADLEHFGNSVMSAVFFSSNIYFWQSTNYFDTSIELVPLIHTWSLAVEEQFYILFPPLLLLGLRLKRKYLLGAVALFFLASLTMANIESSHSGQGAYYLLHTRVFEIVVGVGAAFMLRDYGHFKSLALNQVLSLLGLCMIAYAVLAFDKGTPFPSTYALIPVLGAAFVIISATPKTLAYRLLSLKPAVMIGLISYSTYLWHQPIFAFARHSTLIEISNLVWLLLSAVSIGAGYLSWKFIEAPFRSKDGFNRKQIFQYTAAGMAALFGVGFVMNTTNGFDGRLEGTVLADETLNMPFIDNGWCFYSVDTIDGLEVGDGGLDCFLGTKKGVAAQKAFLVGDSFAAQYEPFWDDVGNQNDISVHALTTNWCYPSFDENFTGPASSPAYEQCLINRAYFKETYESYDFVIVAAQYHRILGTKHEASFLDFLSDLNAGGTTTFIMPQPKLYKPEYNSASVFNKSAWLNKDLNAEALHFDDSLDARIEQVNQRLATFAQTQEHLTFFAPDALFDGKDYSAEGMPFHFDHQHLSIYGAHQAFKRFQETPTYVSFLETIAIPHS